MSASGEFHPDLECGEGAELQRQRVGRLQISLRGQDLTLGSQATEAHVSVLMYRCVSHIVCRLCMDKLDYYLQSVQCESGSGGEWCQQQQGDLLRRKHGL